jgi:hypothetical protein
MFKMRSLGIKYAHEDAISHPCLPSSMIGQAVSEMTKMAKQEDSLYLCENGVCGS